MCNLKHAYVFTFYFVYIVCLCIIFRLVFAYFKSFSRMSRVVSLMSRVKSPYLLTPVPCGGCYTFPHIPLLLSPMAAVAFPMPRHRSVLSQGVAVPSTMFFAGLQDAIFGQASKKIDIKRHVNFAIQILLELTG